MCRVETTLNFVIVRDKKIVRLFCDLWSKGGPYAVANGVVKQFYIDFSLPLAGEQLYLKEMHYMATTNSTQ